MTVNTKRTNGNRERTIGSTPNSGRSNQCSEPQIGRGINQAHSGARARRSNAMILAAGACLSVQRRRQQVDLQRTEGRDEARARWAGRDLDYDGLAWVIATVYATAISALPSPAELKPASVQCGSEAAPRTGFQRGMELGRSVLLVSPESVLLGRTQLGSLITRKIVASSMAYLRRQARTTCA